MPKVVVTFIFGVGANCFWYVPTDRQGPRGSVGWMGSCGGGVWADTLDCKPCADPMDVQAKLSSASALVSDHIAYWSLAGALQYQTFTMLDIAYAIQ